MQPVILDRKQTNQTAVGLNKRSKTEQTQKSGDEKYAEQHDPTNDCQHPRPNHQATH